MKWTWKTVGSGPVWRDEFDTTEMAEYRPRNLEQAIVDTMAALQRQRERRARALGISVEEVIELEHQLAYGEIS